MSPGQPSQLVCSLMLSRIGLLSVVTKVISDSLDSIPNEHGRTKVAFLALDSHIHFFSFEPNGTVRTIVISDVMDDQCLPYSQTCLVNLIEYRREIDELLLKLSSMFKSTQKPQTALCAALEAASKLIMACGGKVVCLLSALGSLPVNHERSLKNREDQKLRGNPKEPSSMLHPSTQFYKMLGSECQKVHVCIDLFLAPSSMSPDNPLSIAATYIDVATLASGARVTGGAIKYYSGFNANTNPELATKLASDLSGYLAQEYGMESVIRIRATQGINMNEYYGSCFMRSIDLLALPVINPDHSFTAAAQIDEALPVPLACVQAALLYTSVVGDRRIRVINGAYPVTDSLKEIFEAADASTIMDYQAKRAVEQVLKGECKYDEGRELIQKLCSDVLVGYRTAYGIGNNPQLQLSEGIRALPLITLGVIKSACLSPEPLPIDYRAAKCIDVLCSSVDDNMHQYVPYFVDLSEYLLGSSDEALLPAPLPLTSEHLDRGHIYLLYDGKQVMIMVGSQVNQNLVNDLFTGELTTKGFRLGLPVSKAPVADKLKRLIDRLGALHHNAHPMISIIHETARERFLFTSRLIEDRGPSDMPSYVNFLQALRDKTNQ
jgi:protein transport protein SEC24